MKIDYTKILSLKGSKTASAPKIGEIASWGWGACASEWLKFAIKRIIIYDNNN